MLQQGQYVVGEDVGVGVGEGPQVFLQVRLQGRLVGYFHCSVVVVAVGCGRGCVMQSIVRTACERVVYICESRCIFRNLAIEDYLLHNAPRDQLALLFYTNTDSVVIGRNQSYFTELNFPAITADIKVARRFSGGGAVFHDIGNVNYSVMMPKDVFGRRWAADLVCSALQPVNAELFVNERNDILLGDCKVSGSAYRIVRERAYHHGTMLLSTDLDKLGNVLRSPVEILEAPTVSSVRSKVANITPKIHNEEFIELVRKKFSPTADVIRIPNDVPIDTDTISSPSWVLLKGSPHAFTFKNAVYRLKDGVLHKNGVPIDDIVSFLKEHKVSAQPVLSKDCV